MADFHARDLFPLADNAVYLNHGGYGLMPKAVMDARTERLWRIERDPTDRYEFEAEWLRVADMIGKRFGCDEQSVAIIDNATEGLVTVLRSLPLQASDEVLITSLGYGAYVQTIPAVIKRFGATMTTAQLRFPDPDPQQCIDAVKKAITSRTKLAVLDHITSGTALVLPIAEMTKICRERDVAVLIDGAHAPGSVELNVPALGADWYIANLHKWYFTPRPCGFLWAAPKNREIAVPNLPSEVTKENYPINFSWVGTRDMSVWSTVPDAFHFMDRFGEERVRIRNHALLREGLDLLAKAWGVKPVINPSMTACMGLITLPEDLPLVADKKTCAKFANYLRNEFDISVRNPQAFGGRLLFGGCLMLRLSAQIYNGIEDFERLGRAVNKMRTEKRMVAHLMM